MRRIALALTFGASMTLLLFWAIDQADKAIPPPIPTPLAQPTMVVVASPSGLLDSGDPAYRDAAPVLSQGPSAISGRFAERTEVRSSATAAARAVVYSVPSATQSAEALLLSAIPSAIPDIGSASPSDVTRALPRTDRDTADTASNSGPSRSPDLLDPNSTSRSAVGSSSAPRGNRGAESGAGVGAPSSGAQGARGDAPLAPAVQGVSRAALPKANREPRYPERIRARGGEGAVSVRIHIDSSGSVASVEVLGASGDPGLRSHVVESLRLWTFEPALDRGRPVPSTMLRKFVFRLDNP